MGGTVALQRKFSLVPIAREISATVSEFVYRPGKVLSGGWTFVWSKDPGPIPSGDRFKALGPLLKRETVERLSELLEELNVYVQVVPGISPTYDNNYYYGDLSIHLTVPEVRSIGQSYLTANLVHELTHAVQEHSRGEDYEGVGPTDPVAYALDPDEIEAHVREFVRRSKGLKVPLEKVVRDHWREFFEGDTAKARRVVREYLRRIRRER